MFGYDLRQRSNIVKEILNTEIKTRKEIDAKRKVIKESLSNSLAKIDGLNSSAIS